MKLDIKLNLGILYNRGNVVNHRSLLKVLSNPLFRYFGYCIGSKFDDNKFVKYVIFKQERVRPIRYSMKCNEFDVIEKIRRII